MRSSFLRIAPHIFYGLNTGCKFYPCLQGPIFPLTFNLNFNLNFFSWENTKWAGFLFQVPIRDKILLTGLVAHPVLYKFARSILCPVTLIWSKAFKSCRDLFHVPRLTKLKWPGIKFNVQICRGQDEQQAQSIIFYHISAPGREIPLTLYFITKKN